MRVTVLGCGGSGGVPLIGNDWGACDPENPRNRRLRVSILVQTEEANILVDTSPDLRQQLLAAGVSRIDAVLYTHCHADHLNGIDDLRTVNKRMGREIDCFGTPETLAEIARRFGYVFEPLEPGAGFYKPCLVPHEVRGPFTAAGVGVTPFEQDHGLSVTTGYRLGPVAYSTDVVNLGEAAFAALEGVEVWIVDCLRYAPHETHAHLDRTLAWIEWVRPRRAVLTHMNQSVDYADIARRLPDGVEPGYDGLVIDTRG